MRVVVCLRLFGLGCLVATPAIAQEPSAVTIRDLSAAQLFVFAENAEKAGDFDAAIAIYKGLTADPAPEIRGEARFRHGKLLAAQKRYSDAAVLYRAILDEQPDAQRVRLELAAMLAVLGDLGAAQRELRLAQAGGLPPEVARLIDQYTNALRANKPYGASFEIAIAPDNNINRATRSETLDTIIAPFDLSEDAQAQSGIGLAAKSQLYFRTGIDKHSRLLVRLSGSADIYRQKQFNDVSLGVQAGPELVSGKDRFNFAGGINYRWFGGAHYSTIISVSGGLQHPTGAQSQIVANASISDYDNRQNKLQDGTIYAGSVGYERAFSNRFGGGVTFGAVRQSLSDPGYATTSGAFNAYAFREMGKATLVASAGYSHLKADQRLFLFPRLRVDDRYSVSLAATFRQIQFKGFAPVLRVEYERNASTVGLYDYNRVAGSFGLTRAF